jgi:hypothetical protein
MTLHEAIKQILNEKGKSTTPQEVADEVNRKDLYRKKNGEKLTASDIIMRAKNYPDLFNIKISLGE